MTALLRLIPQWKTQYWICAINSGRVGSPPARIGKYFPWNKLRFRSSHFNGCLSSGSPAKKPTFMKTTLFDGRAGMLAMALCFCLAGIGRAQVVISPPNYTVTTPPSTGMSGYAFAVNGVSSGQPGQFANVDDSLNFSLNAGATYIITMSTAGIHPVDICTAPNITSHYSGASAQVVSSGTVTLAIPSTGYPTTLYYICNNHKFYGIITVNPPQPPPTATIGKTSLTTTNIVLTFSGGTNTIQLIPQFSSNLVNNVWLPVPSYTNTYSGTGNNNTTSFAKTNLDAACGPDVFLRISQAPN
jgi:hypothetical protein